MANTEKLQEVYDYILMHPEEHNQEVWYDETPCGTTMCIAGTTLALNGKLNDLVNRVGGYSTTARKILGLSIKEANDLFYCIDDKIALDGLLALVQGKPNKFKKL